MSSFRHVGRSVPQANPLADYLEQQALIDAAIIRVFRGGRYIMADEVEAFQNEFAAYLGVKHVIGVASGTDALMIALQACGIGPGDEVITVSHTAIATIVAIERCGATPVFVDIDAGTYTIDPVAARKVLTPRSRAIVPVHLYGLPADMAPLIALAAEKGLIIVEDCAQAHGACYRGQKVGTLGDAAAFSFYPTKNLGAIGDAGCVTTNNIEIAQRAIGLRQYGWRERYISATKGYNSRLDEIQAAILRVKLTALDRNNERRAQIAQTYDRLLGNTMVRVPFCPPDRKHVYHQYVIQVDKRATMRQKLDAIGIGTAIHYPVPAHRQPAYRSATILPVTDSIMDKILSLPMYPQLGEDGARRVAESLLAILGQ